MEEFKMEELKDVSPLLLTRATKIALDKSKELVDLSPEQIQAELDNDPAYIEFISEIESTPF